MNRTRYQKYIGWYSQLSDNEKVRLDNVCNNILVMASDGLEQLDEKTNIAKPFIGAENLLSFYRGEQKKAIDQALEILSTERNGLSTLFGYIVHEVKSGETDISELQPMPGRNITPPEEPLGPNSYKWAEKAAEVLSYLLYAVQIEAIIYEGIFDGTRRRIEAPKDASNEILYLLTRQVIISVGGMDEILGQNQPGESKGSTAAALKSNYSAQQLGQIFDNCYNRGLTKKRDKGKFISMFTTGPAGLVFWGGTKEHGAKTALFDIMYRITDKPFLPSELHEYFDPDEQLEPHDRVITKSRIPHSRVGNKIFAGISKE